MLLSDVCFARVEFRNNIAGKSCSVAMRTKRGNKMFKALAMISCFKFHFFPQSLIFCIFRDPSHDYLIYQSSPNIFSARNQIFAVWIIFLIKIKKQNKTKQKIPTPKRKSLFLSLISVLHHFWF